MILVADVVRPQLWQVKPCQRVYRGFEHFEEFHEVTIHPQADFPPSQAWAIELSNNDFTDMPLDVTVDVVVADVDEVLPVLPNTLKSEVLLLATKCEQRLRSSGQKHTHQKSILPYMQSFLWSN